MLCCAATCAGSLACNRSRDGCLNMGASRKQRPYVSNTAEQSSWILATCKITICTVWCCSDLTHPWRVGDRRPFQPVQHCFGFGLTADWVFAAVLSCNAFAGAVLPSVAQQCMMAPDGVPDGRSGLCVLSTDKAVCRSAGCCNGHVLKV